MAPLNPGNPYNASTTQNGFTTMGQPDIAATMASVASEALKAVWFHKWFVHLRHRPEAGGAIVYLQNTGQGNRIEGRLSNTVLHSQAVKSSFAANNNSYFLSQAFPEGSPVPSRLPNRSRHRRRRVHHRFEILLRRHFPIPNPQVPSSDGTNLADYTGSDAGQLTVNGELNKLAHNISFGHGIHAGIHWRSDTDSSIELGEAVALSVLQERAQTYNEKFTINLTKVDGTTATISNQ